MIDLAAQIVRANRHVRTGTAPQLGCILFLVLSRHFLEGTALRLRHQKGEDHPKEVDHAKDDQDLPDANPVCCIQEAESAHHGPGLAGRGGYAMTRRPEPRWEDLRGDHECGGVGAEVCEEEGE